MKENLKPSSIFTKKESVMDKITEEQLKQIAEETGTDLEQAKSLLSSISATDGNFLD